MKMGLLVLTSIVCFGINAQHVPESFKATRVINGHAVETLKKNILQFRVEHRFGDVIPGLNVSNLTQSWFGFDQASDIRFALEYGITDKFMIGIGRSKGSGEPYKSLVDGFVKHRLLTQSKSSKIPLNITLIGSSTISYMRASTDVTQVQHFPKFSHRMAYNMQLNVTREFGEQFSMALIPTYVHRNYVTADDVNGLFALGSALNLQLSKELGVIAEYYYTFHNNSVRSTNFNSLSAGVEYSINEHVFKLVLTNAKGFNETQFIPGTYSDWLNGEFRLGFSFIRNINLVE